MKKKRKIPESILPSEGSPSVRRLPTDKQGIIERIAKEIRQQYIRRRREHETACTGKQSHYLPGPHWDGGVNRKGHKRSNIWKRVAVFCIKHGLDHFSYLHQVFVNPPSRRAPQPNQLLSERMLNEYRSDTCEDGQQERADYIRRAFEAERIRLQDRLDDWADIVEYCEGKQEYTEREIQRSILSDDNLGLTPLLRFCLAIREKHDDIAEYYYGAAILQYLRFPEAYKTVWGSMIPKWFHSAARRCRKVLLSVEELR